MNLTLTHEPRSARLNLPRVRRGGAIVVAAPSLVALAVHQALLTRPFIDDSYIFYRYAVNWAHGLGLVFNRGEHVEGFSSFLWTAMLTVTAAFGAALQRAGPAIGIALAAGCLVLVATISLGPLALPPWLAALSALALALSPAFVTYASSGMDTMLFAVVLVAAVGATARHVDSVRGGTVSGPWAAAAATLLVALVLARAEGPIYAVAIALVAAALTGRGSVARRRLVTLAPLVAAVAATVAVLAVRRLAYGTLEPATVMAKGYTGHLVGEALAHPAKLSAVWQALRWGVDYVGPLAFLLLALLAVGIAIRARRDRRVPVLPVLGAVAICLAIATALWSTGDWMPYRRLLVPVLPLMVPLGAWAGSVIARTILTRTAARAAAAARLAGLAAIGAGAAAVLSVGVASGPVAPRYEARQLEGLGRLAAGAETPVRLLTNLAGVLPYYAGSRTYTWDMLGLTDIHNARHGQIFSPQFGRTDPAYDFSRPFDLFVSNSSWDFALMAQVLPAGPHRWLLFSSPGWRRIPLYVVARAGGSLPLRLERFCRCGPIVLDASARRRLLAELAQRNAFPQALLEAARTHHPFPG